MDNNNINLLCLRVYLSTAVNSYSPSLISMTWFTIISESLILLSINFRLDYIYSLFSLCRLGWTSLVNWKFP